MSIKKVHTEQPESFIFSKENLEKVEFFLKKYPLQKFHQIIVQLIF